VTVLDEPLWTSKVVALSMTVTVSEPDCHAPERKIPSTSFLRIEPMSETTIGLVELAPAASVTVVCETAPWR